MKRIAIVFMGLIISTPSYAMDSGRIANDLGDVLAAEEACNLKYDPDAIAAYVKNNVPADDMGFAGSLNISSRGAKIFLKKMSPSEKSAHCTQIERVAKSYHFIQ